MQSDSAKEMFVLISFNNYFTTPSPCVRVVLLAVINPENSSLTLQFPSALWSFGFFMLIVLVFWPLTDTVLVHSHSVGINLPLLESYVKCYNNLWILNHSQSSCQLYHTLLFSHEAWHSFFCLFFLRCPFSHPSVIDNPSADFTVWFTELGLV